MEIPDLKRNQLEDEEMYGENAISVFFFIIFCFLPLVLINQWVLAGTLSILISVILSALPTIAQMSLTSLDDPAKVKDYIRSILPVYGESNGENEKMRRGKQTLLPSTSPLYLHSRIIPLA